jgi:hypothetical protein
VGEAHRQLHAGGNDHPLDPILRPIIQTQDFAGSRLFRAYTPTPYTSEADVSASLKPFIVNEADEAPEKESSQPRLNFQPNTIYNVDENGCIITKAGQRQAARMAAEAERANALDPETAAILQEKHDSYISQEIKAAEAAQARHDGLVEALRAEAEAERLSRLSFSSGVAPFFGRPRKPGYAPANRFLRGNLTGSGG